jgi:predicted enzyme related to lactoylglutathione lyase
MTVVVDGVTKGSAVITGPFLFGLASFLIWDNGCGVTGGRATRESIIIPDELPGIRFMPHHDEAGEITFLSPPPRIGGTMKRVTGIGGIFFKAKDAPSLQAWYKRHLGIDVQVWGGAAFEWTDAEGKPVAGTTAWCIDPQESDHFAPSSAPFMVNYRVEDLHALVKVLKEEGCNVLEKIEESEYGKFAWVIDPEGNKVELWQPPQGQ